MTFTNTFQIARYAQPPKSNTCSWYCKWKLCPAGLRKGLFGNGCLCFLALKSSHFINAEISGAVLGIFSHNAHYRSGIMFINSKVLGGKNTFGVKFPLLIIQIIETKTSCFPTLSIYKFPLCNSGLDCTGLKGKLSPTVSSWKKFLGLKLSPLSF